MDSIPKKAQKVQDYLNDKGQRFDIVELPDSTRTAVDAANAIGCKVEQIAKSLIFVDQYDQLVLVIASGTNQVDTQVLAEQTQLQLSMANGKRIKKETGFAIGGVPPVAHDVNMKTLLDVDLRSYGTIWAAAGTPNAVFSLQSQQLGGLTQGQWLKVN